MSTKKEMTKSNAITLSDITDLMSVRPIVQAIKKQNLSYTPTDREKLDQILEHPELLAKVVGLIIAKKTDDEISKIMGITPYSVGLIRDNEFVKEVNASVFSNGMEALKTQSALSANRAMETLSALADKDSDASDKVKYMSAMGIVNTLIKLDENEFKKVNKAPKTPNTVNITQVNQTITADAQEAYNRAMRDMASILPVAQNIYKGGDASGEGNNK